jgi:hypothetical protein
VWHIEITQNLAQNLKHHPGCELGALEVKFGPLPMGKPGLPNLKKVPQSEFVCKSYDHFTEARPGYGSGRWNMTQNQNRIR